MQTTTAMVSGPEGMWERYQRMPRGRKILLTVFMIWLIQAVPKWAVAVTADGHTSAQIMKLFVTPRAETASSVAKSDYSYELVLSHLASGNARVMKF